MAEVDIETEIEIPSYFLCPISLDIMRDPVTVSTGITYERESIEKWLFTQQNTTCPATNQHLPNLDLTPNTTLRRLIQSWCTLHSVQRLPTPKPPRTLPHLLHLLSQAARPHLQSQSLQTLKSLASDSHTNRRCIAASPAPAFLVSLITTKSPSSEEALSILHSLHLPESALKPMCTAAFVESLTLTLHNGSYESRAYAIILLKSFTEAADPSLLIALKPELFSEIAQVLKTENISREVRKSAADRGVPVGSQPNEGCRSGSDGGGYRSPPPPRREREEGVRDDADGAGHGVPVRGREVGAAGARGGAGRRGQEDTEGVGGGQREGGEDPALGVEVLGHGGGVGGDGAERGGSEAVAGGAGGPRGEDQGESEGDS